MSQPDITELAARIATNTAKVKQYYLDKNLPLPSFAPNGPTKSVRPENDFEIEMARQSIILDTNELRILMQGPSDYLTGLCAYVRLPPPPKLPVRLFMSMDVWMKKDGSRNAGTVKANADKILIKPYT